MVGAQTWDLERCCEPRWMCTFPLWAGLWGAGLGSIGADKTERHISNIWTRQKIGRQGKDLVTKLPGGGGLEMFYMKRELEKK